MLTSCFDFKTEYIQQVLLKNELYQIHKYPWEYHGAAIYKRICIEKCFYHCHRICFEITILNNLNFIIVEIVNFKYPIFIPSIFRIPISYTGRNTLRGNVKKKNDKYSEAVVWNVFYITIVAEDLLIDQLSILNVKIKFCVIFSWIVEY